MAVLFSCIICPPVIFPISLKKHFIFLVNAAVKDRDLQELDT